MSTKVIKTRGQEPRQARRLLFQTYVDPANETRYFAKDQTNTLGRWATVRDPENPDGVMMSELIDLMNQAPSPSKKAKPRKARG